MRSLNFRRQKVLALRSKKVIVDPEGVRNLDKQMDHFIPKLLDSTDLPPRSTSPNNAAPLIPVPALPPFNSAGRKSHQNSCKK